MEHIYEVVDATDDERYYSLGVFLTEAEAVSLLDGDDPPHNDDDPDAVIIQVRTRPIGFHPHAYTEFASRTWIRNYEDDKPDWTAQAIKFRSPNKVL